MRAPKIDFDNEKRAVFAESDKSQMVSSLFVQQSQDGKTTPVDMTADKLTYVDEERLARYTGNVLAKTTTGHGQRAATRRLSERRLSPNAIMAPAGPQQAGAAERSIASGSDAPSKIDHMVATGKVVVTEPNRRAVGDRLVYTADDGKYILTGKSPSIFDAERGTVWGDSLTFYSHDDRVLVESKRSSPTITRARTTK